MGTILFHAIRENDHFLIQGIVFTIIVALGVTTLILDVVYPWLDRADEGYRKALTLAEQLGMRPLIAHCDLGLSALYRRTGRHQPAQEHLTTATTMYREMGMTYWLAQAEAELK